MKRQRILNHYQARVDPQRESFDILDWGSQREQEQRFQVLRDALIDCGIVRRETDRGFSLLDVGCGLGDLHRYLRQDLAPMTYVGVDIVEPILKEARRRCPEGHFVLGDVFETRPFRPASFDVVFCSGVFNLKLGNNDDFAIRALPRLLELCSQCLMVNFLHERTPVKHPHCWYFSPEQIIQSLPVDPSAVRLIDDYLDKDFSILISR